MIAKTVSALTPPSGLWRSQVLLVADNDRDADGQADLAGPFQPLLTEMATGLPGICRRSGLCMHQIRRVMMVSISTPLSCGPTFLLHGIPARA